ncbi:MAG: trypsin-like serine protease, partial [Chloroflexota bacterium]
GNTDITADEIAGSSQVFTSYYGNLWFPAQKIYPHKWVGRFSFITNNGTSYCSATAISKNHIVTAAHCVFDTVINQWYTNKVFTPAYRNGSAPYGSFIATSCTILNQWKYMSGDFSINRWTKYDVAVCRVRTNSEGKTLNYMVGWAGREWDEGYMRNFFNMGYPWKDTSLNYLNRAGQFLRICTAESFQQATDTLGMGCNYGSGISGGPWMISYAPNVLSGYVNSVNSGLYIGQDNLYGIRFTSNNIVPICIEQGCD